MSAAKNVPGKKYRSCFIPTLRLWRKWKDRLYITIKIDGCNGSQIALGYPDRVLVYLASSIELRINLFNLGVN